MYCMYVTDCERSVRTRIQLNCSGTPSIRCPYMYTQTIYPTVCPQTHFACQAPNGGRHKPCCLLVAHKHKTDFALTERFEGVKILLSYGVDKAKS